MKTIIKIMKNELYTLFYSPIAWLVLIIFAFQAGMAFSDAYLDQLRQQALDYSLYGVTRSLLFGWDGVISSMQRQLYLYIPLLTMGLMSQEYNRGSIKLLYSSPITNNHFWEISRNYRVYPCPYCIPIHLHSIFPIYN